MDAAQRAEVDRIRATASLAIVIGETVPLERTGRLLIGRCPFHAEKTPSFCVWPDHYHCFGCNAHGDVFDWLTRARGMGFREAVVHLGGAGNRQCDQAATPAPALAPARAGADDADARRNRELARRIWCESVDPRCTPVETYLQYRGVRLPDAPTIRWHPACPCTGGPLPAMVAVMTDPLTGEPCGIHRTFLQSDGSGKAAVEKPKKMLARAGVIRLMEDDDVTLGLGIAEGIETGLAVMQHSGWRPVWAAGSAGAIRGFPIPEGIEALTIFADRDDKGAGIAAASACAARWTAAGRNVLVHVPPAGADWHDALSVRP